MRRKRLALTMAVALAVVAAATVGCESSIQTPASDKSKAEAHESETSKDKPRFTAR